MTNTVLSTDGRQVGERGRQTRLKLLKSLATELGVTGYRGSTVADVARRARTSPATFYQYFSDLDEAVLTLAEAVAIAGSISSPPTETDGDSAHGLVHAFFALYERHRAVLRVIDMKAAEGDQRFTALRIQFLSGLQAELERTASAARPAAGAQAVALAVAPLVLMLAATAAHEDELTAWSLEGGAVRASAAEMVHTAVTGATA
ncbi:TetR family transcriptional regulator [Streptomyces sp. RKAG337]|uniref:TetR family transcriptional regulator n=1 Tax=Streptomyces sp. RKAG337 TaxID=2893404 RepID=UPI002033C401|nr:TetR family transcriptional regulator [Streptomyces sp. RKAG337]MCM2430949.1 TetR/AcrR family transcriptional regulator [Streptomyces sp. RKAG337]